MLKSKLENLLAVALVFLLVTGWIFSGWPHIWQGPPVPSEVKTVEANPDIEIKKPTSHTDGTGWTNPAQAYDLPSTANDQTTEGDDTSMEGDPAITFHNWASKVETYTVTVLKVNWKTNGLFVGDQFAIQYMKDGSNWLDIVTLGVHNETTIQTSSISLDVNQDLSLVQVKVVATKSGDSDGGTLYIYDIWTEGEYTPNATPSVSSVNLTPSPIVLTENTTTTVTCTATITDTDGGATISSATGTIYRSGVGYSCSQNDNNCYPNKACTLSAADGNNKYATCTADIWFHADPTDSGDYSGDTWQCYIIAEDDQGATATNTDDTPPELNTLNALIVTSSISYGTLAPGATSSASQITTVTTTGNTAIDVNISGADMTTSTYSIPVSQQEYATSSVDYGSGTDASSTAVTLVLESGKPTTHPSNQADDIYWRIEIPSGQEPVTYYGTTTIATKAK